MRPSDLDDQATRLRFASDPSVRRLTPREHAVARLVAIGLKDVVIGRRLGLTPATVKNYVQRIQRRLGLVRREDIVDWVAARVTPGDPNGRLRRIEAERSA